MVRSFLVFLHVNPVWLCKELLTALPADVLAAELGGRALQLVHLDEARLRVVVQRISLLLMLVLLLALVGELAGE